MESTWQKSDSQMCCKPKAGCGGFIWWRTCLFRNGSCKLFWFLVNMHGTHLDDFLNETPVSTLCYIVCCLSPPLHIHQLCNGVNQEATFIFKDGANSEQN